MLHSDDREYKVVTKRIRKKDAMQLVTGQPVYMDDITSATYAPNAFASS